MKSNIKLSEIKDIPQRFDIPQTDFTKQIQVNVYEAKKFLGIIENHISICETLNLDAKHWRSLGKEAHKLFGIPYNGTDSATQSKIEEAYNKQEKK